MKAENIYMWFKIYQRDIKDDGAKWDFLHHVKQETLLTEKHELFYQEYGKKRGLIK